MLFLKAGGAERKGGRAKDNIMGRGGGMQRIGSIRGWGEGKR